MNKISLTASKREVIGKKVKVLRKEGILPAVIYGAGVKDPIAVSLKFHETSKALRGATASTLIGMEVDGKEYNVLLRDRQYDVLKGTYLHIDFLAVALDQLVNANARIILTGVSPAIETYEAIISAGLGMLEVEALPMDLPESITVDISGLEEIGQGIFVKDLELPDNVKSLDDPEALIAIVTAPTLVEEEEEEEELLEEGEEGAEPDVIEKGKSEEEE